MNLSEATGWTIDDFWMISGESELADLIVHLSLINILKEEEADTDLIDYVSNRGLKKDMASKVIFEFKDRLDEVDYASLLSDLERIIQIWR